MDLAGPLWLTLKRCLGLIGDVCLSEYRGVTFLQHAKHALRSFNGVRLRQLREEPAPIQLVEKREVNVIGWVRAF
jgi:hypothetical protein